MEFQFKRKQLEKLYTEDKNAHKYPEEVIGNFFEVMLIIQSAPDERSLYQYRGLRFEKLQGKRGKEGQHSIRLNKQFRLILTIETDTDGKYLLIIEIVDYHKAKK